MRLITAAGQKTPAVREPEGLREGFRAGAVDREDVPPESLRGMRARRPGRRPPSAASSKAAKAKVGGGIAERVGEHGVGMKTEVGSKRGRNWKQGRNRVEARTKQGRRNADAGRSCSFRTECSPKENMRTNTEGRMSLPEGKASGGIRRMVTKKIGKVRKGERRERR